MTIAENNCLPNHSAGLDPMNTVFCCSWRQLFLTAMSDPMIDARSVHVSFDVPMKWAKVSCSESSLPYSANICRDTAAEALAVDEYTVTVEDDKRALGQVVRDAQWWSCAARTPVNLCPV